MVIASLTGVVEVMRKGLVPAVMANARKVSASAPRRADHDG